MIGDDITIHVHIDHVEGMQPVLVIEVDGFAYHNNEKQKERDTVKDSILKKYGIPILRLSTVGSGEREKVIAELTAITMGI